MCNIFNCVKSNSFEFQWEILHLAELAQLHSSRVGCDKYQVLEEERAKTFELTTRRGDGQKKHSPKCGFSNCGLTQLVPGKHEGTERKLKKRALFRPKIHPIRPKENFENKSFLSKCKNYDQADNCRH